MFVEVYFLYGLFEILLSVMIYLFANWLRFYIVNTNCHGGLLLEGVVGISVCQRAKC